MLKKILLSLLSIQSSIYFTQYNVFAAGHQNSMLPNSTDWKWVTQNLLDDWDWEDQADQISSWVVESIEWLLPLVAIGVFLFVGIKLAIAKWNPEEFKKAWMQFVYAIVGIFAVSFAWVTVKLVSGLSF